MLVFEFVRELCSTCLAIFMEILSQNRSNIIPAHFELVFSFFMGEPQSPHFYDFGNFERVPEPRHQDT